MSDASALRRTSLWAFRPGAAWALDWGERLVVVALYAWMVARLVASCSAHGRYGDLLLLPSEGLVVFFILIRRAAQQVSLRPGDWLLALAATALPKLVESTAGRPLCSATICCGLILAGMIVQIHAKLALGRSMGCVPAHRGLKFSGPYRFVRHPMYAGYALSQAAFVLLNPTLWNAGLLAASTALLVWRLQVEETLLGQDPQYRTYAADVRFRLIPYLY